MGPSPESLAAVPILTVDLKGLDTWALHCVWDQGSGIRAKGEKAALLPGTCFISQRLTVIRNSLLEHACKHPARLHAQTGFGNSFLLSP